MAESLSEAGQTAQDVVRGAFDASLTFIKLPEGAKIGIHISTDNIRVAKELCRLVGYVGLGIGGASLGALLGYTVLKPLVVSAVKRAFGGDRDDQDTDDIGPGSLHVVIRCLTDERFLEIVDDYETGRMKTRLEDEFAQIGIEVEGLKVEIVNIEEVNKTKEEINKKRTPFLMKETETSDEKSDGHNLEIQRKMGKIKITDVPESTSQRPKVVQDGLHLTREDGTLSQSFDPRTGKWGKAPTKQEWLAFDRKTGKLVVAVEIADNVIAISMAAAGFFSRKHHIEFMKQFATVYSVTACRTVCISQTIRYDS